MIKLLCLFLFSFSAFAYEIPADEEVLTIHNQTNEEVFLYPFDINIVVWNILKGKKENWKTDFYKFSQEADLLLLQETFLNKKVLDTFQFMQWFQFNTAISWVRKGVPSGVSIVGKGKPAKLSWQRSLAREPFLKTPKMTIFASYKLAGLSDDLLIANIHALNFVSSEKLKNQLDKVIHFINKHNGPILFAGDFNTWTKKKVDIMKKSLTNAGLTHVKFKNDNRKKVLGSFLDHAWVKDLKVISAISPITKSSDHNPMLLQLSVY